MGDFIILGAGGMLGRCWSELLAARGIEHRSFARSELDLRDSSAVRDVISSDTDWIVNCAAYTAVDAAESDEESANEVNGYAVGRLAEHAREVGAKLLHYSTDYVFNGQASAPYSPDEPRAPLNAYGRSKALGERLLEESGAEYLLVRSSWLYAPWGQNFVLTMRRLATTKQRLRVVNDQRGRPTDCRQLAAVSLRLAESGCRGAFHATDGGECTWFDLASLVAEIVNTDCVVEPCTSDEFPRPAVRPAYSVLDVAATEAVAGPLVDWQERVRDVLAAVRREDDA